MAGGSGTRLWPVSRETRPKQFQMLVGDRSLLQQTCDRLLSVLPLADIHVCTVAEYAPLVREQLPDLPTENLIVEPAARSTAPAMGLAALLLQRRYGETLVASVAADHVIRRPEAFAQALRTAFAAVRERPSAVVTIGIRPTVPDTGYGYIRVGGLVEAAETGSVYAVEEFVEKPDAARAQQFLAAGSYLWNASYFIWSTSQMLALLERHLPEVATGLRQIDAALGAANEVEALREAYAAMPKVAIDTGVMERADDVLVVPAEMEWSDVGSWERLHEVLSGDSRGVVAVGPHVGLDDRDCLFYSQNRLIATLGLEEIVVVETEDAILVCHKSRSQDLKNLMDRLRQAGRGQLLG
jgi:mannose-1-phosphate guanylyltransferase